MNWGHPRNPGYIAGEPWMESDLNGRDYRQSEMKKTWDGLWVHKSEWEPRHPQDFVRGVKDRQAVDNPRPTFNTAMGETAVSVAGSKGDATLDVDSVTYIADGDSVGITLDNGNVQWTFLTDDPTGTLMPLNDKLLDDVAVDNVVYYSDNGSGNFLSVGDVSSTDL